MKVRFYADVPSVFTEHYAIFATTKPTNFCMDSKWKRIAFDVDFPPDVMREFDAKAPAQFVGVVDDGTEDQE